jgi:hypothetical protein
MYPTISAALADDHRSRIIHDVEMVRQARRARPDASGQRPARRVVAIPLVLFRGWLARGYL